MYFLRCALKLGAEVRILATLNLTFLASIGRKIRIHAEKGRFSLSWERDASGD